jgi:L-ascorbate metabolism protein UlaG (beta-lactamase superfamily)
MSSSPRISTNRLRVLRYLWDDIGRPIQPAPHHPAPRTWPADRLTAAWLGHATVLLNFHGLTILTDPVFFARVGIRLGPVTVGPKRHVACALKPSELPPIDLVLLSHAHMDHLDLRSLGALPRGSTVVTSSHTADLLSRRRFRDVHELGWGETIDVLPEKGGLTIRAERMRHWGARLQRDHHRGYNAYVLERAGQRICFVGDTARTDASHLGARGKLDLMMVPIGAYHPWIRAHCTPEEAVEMADEAGAEYILPFHHETFKLSWEPLDEPIRRLRAALQHQPWRLATAEVGDTFQLPGLTG